jgi:hypothetical protein
MVQSIYRQIYWPPHSPDLTLLDLMLRHCNKLWKIRSAEYKTLLQESIVTCCRIFGSEQNIAFVCAEPQTEHILNSTKLQYYTKKLFEMLFPKL